MGDFLMPSLGADMDSGKVVEWRVRPGESVHRGDIVAVVDTEKSDIEVEVFEDGVVEELLVDVGEEVAVGTPLARITSSATASPAASAAAAPTTAESTTAAPAPHAPAGPAVTAEPAQGPAVVPEPAQGPAVATATAAGAPPARPPTTPADEHVRASPRARRQAAELGVDLSGVAGTGPGGAVLAVDLATSARSGTSATSPAAAVPSATSPAAGSPAAACAPAPAPRSAADRQAAMRRSIGELMARSKREVPHFYVATTIDLHAATAWLEEQNARRPVAERLLPAVLLLKATALAARQVPVLNGFWDDGFRAAPAVHLGVAVALRGGGLIAPAIHDADQLGVDELMRKLRDLVERARGGRLRSSEMSDPTITVTNLGEQGAEEVYGVIYPPQVALVGFGRVAERPWVADGVVCVRPTVRATLSVDHRACDGHLGSRFLAAVEHLLQNPEEL